MSRIAIVRTAVTADGRLVLDTDPAAEFLVAGVGGVIPDEYAAQELPGAEKPSPVIVAEKPKGESVAKPRKS